jgi:hypothetical protein
MRDPLRSSPSLAGAVGTLLLAAFGARIAWWLLEPLVPLLAVLIVLLGVLRLTGTSRRRW